MKKTGKNKGLTLVDVVNHISTSKQQLSAQIHALKKKVDDFRKDFNAHRKGVDDLDFRVQDIEEEELPRRVNTIEKHLQLINA